MGAATADIFLRPLSHGCSLVSQLAELENRSDECHFCDNFDHSVFFCIYKLEISRPMSWLPQVHHRQVLKDQLLLSEYTDQWLQVTGCSRWSGDIFRHVSFSNMSLLFSGDWHKQNKIWSVRAELVEFLISAWPAYHCPFPRLVPLSRVETP